MTSRGKAALEQLSAWIADSADPENVGDAATIAALAEVLTSLEELWPEVDRAIAICRRADYQHPADALERAARRLR